MAGILALFHVVTDNNIEVLKDYFIESRLDACILLAAASVALYDYILTFPREKEVIWTGGFNITKALYLLNRNMFLVFALLHLCALFVLPVTEGYLQCGAIVRLYGSLEIFPAACIRGIFLLRTFALYKKNRLVLCVLGVPGLGIIASIISNAVVVTCVPLYLPSSVYPTEQFSKEILVSSALYTTCTVLSSTFDFFVLILTIARTYKMTIQARSVGIKNSLWSVLMKDGILYYIVVFFPQNALLVISVISIKKDFATLIYLSNNVYPICQMLSSVMANRLVLNLCQSAVESRIVSANPSIVSPQISVLRFHTGSMDGRGHSQI